MDRSGRTVKFPETHAFRHKSSAQMLTCDTQSVQASYREKEGIISACVCVCVGVLSLRVLTSDQAGFSNSVFVFVRESLCLSVHSYTTTSCRI